MPNSKYQNRQIRKLSKTGGGKSFAITLPMEYIKKLKWKEKQKLQVEMKGRTIFVKDWKR